VAQLFGHPVSRVPYMACVVNFECCCCHSVIHIGLRVSVYNSVLVKCSAGLRLSN